MSISNGTDLLAAIRANPDDDTPRLVYADWLDENGQPDRAAFIRLQVELARTSDRKQRDRLERREYEMLKKPEFRQQLLQELLSTTNVPGALPWFDFETFGWCDSRTFAGYLEGQVDDLRPSRSRVLEMLHSVFDRGFCSKGYSHSEVNYSNAAEYARHLDQGMAHLNRCTQPLTTLVICDKFRGFPGQFLDNVALPNHAIGHVQYKCLDAVPSAERMARLLNLGNLSKIAKTFEFSSDTELRLGEAEALAGAHAPSRPLQRLSMTHLRVVEDAAIRTLIGAENLTRVIIDLDAAPDRRTEVFTPVGRETLIALDWHNRDAAQAIGIEYHTPQHMERLIDSKRSLGQWARRERYRTSGMVRS